MSRVANVPHWVPRPKDPKFDTGKISSYKFVDDGINTSAVNMRKARRLVEEGQFFKKVIDIHTQNFLKHISDRAEMTGMCINAKKLLLCVFPLQPVLNRERK